MAVHHLTTRRADQPEVVEWLTARETLRETLGWGAGLQDGGVASYLAIGMCMQTEELSGDALHRATISEC